MKKLLVVVDYQNDFVDGTLGFAGAELLEPGIAKRVEQTLAESGYVLFTRDSHEEDYLQTREGQYLPVPHCYKGTTGHQLYGSLHTYEENPQTDVAILDKPTFGSPEIGEVAFALCNGTPDVIELCGLVTDICVISNAILLHSFFPTTTIQVNRNLCGSGNPQNSANAFQILEGLGIQIV